MQMLSGSVAALAVASIYYVWRTYAFVQLRCEQQLRERVAYLLFVLAEQAD